MALLGTVKFTVNRSD